MTNLMRRFHQPLRRLNRKNVTQISQDNFYSLEFWIAVDRQSFVEAFAGEAGFFGEFVEAAFG